MAGPLGRREPTDWAHVERYPLRALAAEDQPTSVPVVIGVNWYTAMDRPFRRNGRWTLDSSPVGLGSLRGGHSVVLRPRGVIDTGDWWGFYDQGHEGACVGFAWSRAMTLLNRRRYQAGWLYREAQLRDEWTDTPPGEGTSVRAGGNVLTDLGHLRLRQAEPRLEDGIHVYRWATSVEDVVRTLGYPESTTHVPMLNSWGRDYPHITWMELELLDGLRREDGELAVPTDR
jgi:hypothetical protein